MSGLPIIRPQPKNAFQRLENLSMSAFFSATDGLSWLGIGRAMLS
jgi:hypothetical protein